jgi:hypothetical protein
LPKSTSQDCDQLHQLDRSNPDNIHPYISLERIRVISKAYSILEREPQVKNASIYDSFNNQKRELQIINSEGCGRKKIVGYSEIVLQSMSKWIE